MNMWNVFFIVKKILNWDKEKSSTANTQDLPLLKNAKHSLMFAFEFLSLFLLKELKCQ